MCILLLTACGSIPTATQFGLDEAVVRRAILLQLSEKERFISESLSTNRPELEISGVKIKSIKSTKINKSSALHLEGDYNLRLNLPRQQATQQQNPFELYLQRQIEGKTWRLLKQNIQGEWLSYSLW